MKDSYLSESDVQDIINAVGYECKNPRGLREALESVFFDPSHWKVRYPTKAASLKKNLGEKKDFDDFFDKIDEAILLTLTSLKVLNEDLTKEYGFLTQSDLDKAFLVIASMGKLSATNLNLEVRSYDLEKNYLAVKNMWLGFED